MIVRCKLMHVFPKLICQGIMAVVPGIAFVQELPRLDIRGISPARLQVTPPGGLPPANSRHRSVVSVEIIVAEGRMAAICSNLVFNLLVLFHDDWAQIDAVLVSKIN